ncbi:4-alpha-glucanotransferase [Tissierella creatinini]|nr:4-alpha-glucanotransferase [Tissierella creatinini]TJX64675.1 4-alpha-glucanotransferase [Soehngenia saccharolytica]
MGKRASGILMHISSLPSKYGIGDFGIGAYNFVDFLSKANQKYWQILPLCITGYGDSPYQSVSVFAGNPYFINIDEFLREGFLSKDDILQTDLGNNQNLVDYSKLFFNKTALLRKAYNNAKEILEEKLLDFYDREKEWLRGLALYMALKAKNSGVSWQNWPIEYRTFNSPMVMEFEKNNEDEIFFWVFTQYYFYAQWNRLKSYANKHGIKIIGDLPIYVAEDSADCWTNPKNFKFDENLVPKTIAGVPPDAFSDTGQLWGNPIYDWDYLEATGFDWWIKRIRHGFRLYDTLRIDHFRGFDAYWEVKYGDKTAVNGKWKEGPGIKLFNKVKESLGDLDIIAEDLGVYSEGLGKLLEDTRFPNMKILQFAFDTKGDSHFMPHNYDKNCVVYIGTHDNHPAMAWFETAPIKEYEFAVEYFKLDENEGLNWGLLRGAWASPANLAIGQLQDFLGLGEESRMNEPSTMGKNWTWRVTESLLTDSLAERIANLTSVYRR